MPTEPLPPTVAEVVRRAAEICDPEAASPVVEDLMVRFEDRDEPITAVVTLGQQLAEASGIVDPESDDPAVAMTVAVTLYLAHRRDEMDDAPEDVLRLAARAEFDGSPPEHVASWLETQGVSI